MGETGLDFNRNYSPPEAQEFAFRQQIQLAVELGMPLFCHQRDAHERFISLLREYRNAVTAVVVRVYALTTRVRT